MLLWAIRWSTYRRQLACTQLCKSVINALQSLTIPLARLLGVVISLITAKLRLTLPLLMPPMIRAITNTVKLCETAHTAYDSAIPICHINNMLWLLDDERWKHLIFCWILASDILSEQYEIVIHAWQSILKVQTLPHTRTVLMLQYINILNCIVSVAYVSIFQYIIMHSILHY